MIESGLEHHSVGFHQPRSRGAQSHDLIAAFHQALVLQDEIIGLSVRSQFGERMSGVWRIVDAGRLSLPVHPYS
jgi:hypothetical protein